MVPAHTNRNDQSLDPRLPTNLMNPFSGAVTEGHLAIPPMLWNSTSTSYTPFFSPRAPNFSSNSFQSSSTTSALVMSDPESNLQNMAFNSTFQPDFSYLNLPQMYQSFFNNNEGHQDVRGDKEQIQNFPQWRDSGWERRDSRRSMDSSALHRNRFDKDSYGGNGNLNERDTGYRNSQSSGEVMNKPSSSMTSSVQPFLLNSQITNNSTGSGSSGRGEKGRCRRCKEEHNTARCPTLLTNQVPTAGTAVGQNEHSQSRGFRGSANDHRYSPANHSAATHEMSSKDALTLAQRPRQPLPPFRNPKPTNQMTKLAHAEDLQPNEGFTGVKTTSAHHGEVPKVLPAGSRNNRRGAWIGPKRGAPWQRRGGKPIGRGGFRPPNAPHLTPEAPSTPHFLPSDALNKAMNNSNLVPQKRKLLGSGTDPAVSSSGSSISSAAGPSSGRDFSHLLPTVKRRKGQDQGQEAREPVHSKSRTGDGGVQGEQVEEWSGRGDGMLPEDGIHEGQSEQRPDVVSIKAEPVENEYQISSANIISTSLPPSTLDAISPQLPENPNPSSSQVSQAANAVTPITVKDEPLDLDISYTESSDFSQNSGTKRYHPVPPSCHKFYSIDSNTNSQAPSTSSNAESPSEHLVPNPHVKTARAAFSAQAIEELRAKGLVVIRVLWRPDGMCIDWEKPRSIPQGKKTRRGGKKVPPKKQIVGGNRTKEPEKVIGLVMNGLFTMDDEDVKPRFDADSTILESSGTSSAPSEPLRSTPVLPVANVDVSEIIDLTSDKDEPSNYLSTPHADSAQAKSVPPPSSSLSSLDNSPMKLDVERKTNSHKYDPPLVVRLGSGRSKTQKISPSPAASTKPKSCATSGAVGTYPGSPSISVVSRRATPISGAAHESTGKFLDSSPHSSRQTQSLPPAPPSVQNPLPLLVNVSKSSQPPPSSADPVLHNIPVEVDKPSFSYEYEIDGVPVIDTDIVRPNPETGDTEEEEMQVLGELSYPASSDMDNSLDSEDLTKGLEYAAVHGVSNTEGDMEHESRGPGARSTSVQTSADLEKTPDAGDATKAPREGDRSKLDGKAELEQRAIDFLHQYIRTWEYDRAGLSRAYAANAVFTCSVVLPPSSSLSPAVSPTQAFASHFVTSISAFIPSSLSSTSSRLLQRPPVPIQTPAIISPALLLLDPQRLFTFFPHGEQAQLAYEALYLGDFDSSLPLPANQYVQLYGQVEMRRRLAKSAQTMKGKERARANEDEETLSITWTFLLRADASKKMSGEDNEFPMQIMTHQMEVRDGQ